MLSWPKLATAIAFLALPLGWHANRRYRQMPQLPSNAGSCKRESKRADQNSPRSSFPSVSIIVPARNEASNIQRLLSSLCDLEYPGKLEVIVVDDNSVDETVAIARGYNVRVLSLDGLPEDWLGKPHACHRGAAAACGDWLLFTDADTEHTVNGLAYAVEYVLNNQLDGLTCHLQHQTYGLLDSLTLTAAYAGLFAGLPQTHTAMNGQYVLLRHEVYLQCGGFMAVRQEPLEDLALGRRLHQMGYRVPVLRGEEIAEVAMYQSSLHLWRGMSRIGAGSLRGLGAHGLLTALFITALMTPLLALCLALAGRLPVRWIIFSWAAVMGGIWPWSQRFGGRWHLPFIPIGALFVQASAIWGLFNKLIGHGLYWKGRTV